MDPKKVTAAVALGAFAIGAGYLLNRRFQNSTEGQHENGNENDSTTIVEETTLSADLARECQTLPSQTSAVEQSELEEQSVTIDNSVVNGSNSTENINRSENATGICQNGGDNSEQLSGNVGGDNSEQLSVDVGGDNSEQLSVDVGGDNAEQLSVDVGGDNSEQLSVDVGGDNSEQLSVDVGGDNSEQLSVNVGGDNSGQLSGDARGDIIFELLTEAGDDNSLRDKKKFFRLIEFSYELSLNVVRAFVESNILKDYNDSLEHFLNTHKHRIYHLWNFNTPCCIGDCTKNPNRELLHDQIIKLYDLPINSTSGHFQKRGNSVTQYCACVINVRNSCSLKNLDITLIHTVLRHCVKLQSDEDMWLNTIRCIRNKLSHVKSITDFDTGRLDKWWDMLEGSVLGLARKIKPAFYYDSIECQINSIKKSDFETSYIQDIFVKLKTDYQQFHDSIKTDIKEVSRILEDDVMKELKDIKEVVVDIRNVSFKIAPQEPSQLRNQNSISAESCDFQGSNVCYVKWKIDTPNSWQVQHIKDTLEHVSAILSLMFKVEFVYVGSLIIVTTVPTHVIMDRQAFEIAVGCFLQKIVEVCEIDTNSPATVHVELILLQDFNDFCPVDKDKDKENLTRNVTPVGESVPPVFKSDSPIGKSVSAVGESVSAVGKSVSPVVKSVSPVVESISPLVESVSPVIKGDKKQIQNVQEIDVRGGGLPITPVTSSESSKTRESQKANEQTVESGEKKPPERSISSVLDVYDLSPASPETDTAPLAPKERVPENMNLIIKQWRLKDKLFVETSSSKALAKELQTLSVAVVTGSPGTGKSSTAQHTLLLLNANGYDIIQVTSSADMVRYFTKQHRQVFYIDDLCGKYNISSYDIEEWERNKDMISDIFTSPLAKCLFTCRLQIYQDPIFSKLELTNVKVFDLSGSHQLTLDEKMSVGKKYLQEDVLKCISNETMTQSEFFPLLCSLYDKHSNESTLFFEKPKSYFKTELDELKYKPDKLKYACIVLCVMFNDNVTDDIFTQSADVTRSNRLKVTLEECEVNTSIPKKTIISQFESMVGTYFQKSETGYKSIHDYMFDIYCSHVSTSMLQCVIEHADSKLIRDRALLQSLDEDNQEFTIIIPPTMEIVFFNRIKDDIKNNKIWDAYSSRQCKYESYQSKLSHFLEKNKDIINITDKDGITALYVTSYNGYSVFVDMLLTRGGNVNQCTKDGRTPLYVASQKGHRDIVDMLLYRGGNVNQCTKDGRTPLYVASQEGHRDIVDMLLTRGGNINQCTEDGRTPLYVASQKGHRDIVHMLLYRGGNVNQCTKDGRTPLYVASQKGHRDIVDMLLYRGGNVNQCTKDGRTPLYVASQEGHRDIFVMLLTRGGNINQCTKDGRTPLYVASQKGHRDIVDMLLYRGGNVNQCTKDGRTPLYVASQKGHMDIVEMLLTRVGNVNQSTMDGRTPLYVASQEGHCDIVDMLCKLGGNVNQCTTKGYTPLYAASFNGHKTCVYVLLTRGADVNTFNNEGVSPLYVASHNGHSDIVDMLCNRGGNINQCTKDGRTPLYVASQKGHSDIVDVLCSRGGNVNQCTKDGCTPLYTASFNGHKTCVEVLLTKGADVNTCNNEGVSPLYVASHNGHSDIVDMLFNRGGNVNQCTKD